MESISSFFSGWEISSIDIGVLVVYLILMAAVGYMCRKSSSNISDYVRMGNKGTWWLIGLSIFMQAVSASTFTANAGVAYLAGWSVFLTGAGVILGLLIHGFFLAGWMRKTRAVTPMDAIRLRFGPVMEQVLVYIGLTSIIWGGVFLLGLANFLSAAFNLPVEGVIIFTGVIVVFYSVSGGSWSVMITDNLQSMILIPICIVLAFLSLKAVGGFGGLLEAIQVRGLSGDFRFIKEAGHVYKSTIGHVGKGYFSGAWVLASMLYGIVISVNITQCHRYLSAKTSADAHKAAFFAAGLIALGMFIWYIPPMVGRVLYQDKIEALGAQPAELLVANSANSSSANIVDKTDTEKIPKRTRAALKNPAEGSYAIVAKELLPNGLLGLIVIAMFAAAMSSMDSFLTGTAGAICKNLYPPLARKFGKKPVEGKALLRLTKFVNLGLGLWAMGLAMYLYHSGGGGGVYEISLQFVLLIGVPFSLPLSIAFFAKKLPLWGPFVGVGIGLVFSALFMFGAGWGIEWVGKLMWHQRMYIMILSTVIPTWLTSLFWKRTPQSYKDHVAHFYQMMKTPIDFKEEVGESEDHTLLNIVGGLGLLIAGLILLLIFFVDDSEGRYAVLFVAGTIGSISGAMYYVGKKREKTEQGTWGSHKPQAKQEE